MRSLAISLQTFFIADVILYWEYLEQWIAKIYFNVNICQALRIMLTSKIFSHLRNVRKMNYISKYLKIVLDKVILLQANQYFMTFKINK